MQHSIGDNCFQLHLCLILAVNFQKSAKSKRYALFQVAVEGQLVHSRKKLQDPCLDNKLRQPSHPTRGAPVAISCLSTLLKEPVLLYKTCLCIWLLSYYEPAIEYLATSRTMQRLTEVVKSSTKEKVVRVVILTFRNLLPKGTFGAQMVDLGLPHIIHSLKTQAWSDEKGRIQVSQQSFQAENMIQRRKKHSKSPTMQKKS
ncbi:hypothetical protein F2Q68_00006483 [Brassica cretica]|uniref:Uncharacterized protein n=1 Tax=Brassica cretica TaxID=69181 RepID=A0A8S9JG90_BRACR|nr:hypothetical protein F2Q68_00006483 [Brassica cretica]